MIHLNYMVVHSEPGFVERNLRDLLCGIAQPAERPAWTRGWGLGRRR